MCYRCSFCRKVVPHGTPRRVHVTYRRVGPLKGTIERESPACGNCLAEQQSKPLPPLPAPKPLPVPPSRPVFVETKQPSYGLNAILRTAKRDEPNTTNQPNKRGR